MIWLQINHGRRHNLTVKYTSIWFRCFFSKNLKHFTKFQRSNCKNKNWRGLVACMSGINTDSSDILEYISENELKWSSHHSHNAWGGNPKTLFSSILLRVKDLTYYFPIESPQFFLRDFPTFRFATLLIEAVQLAEKISSWRRPADDRPQPTANTAAITVTDGLEVDVDWTEWCDVIRHWSAVESHRGCQWQRRDNVVLDVVGVHCRDVIDWRRWPWCCVLDDDHHPSFHDDRL